MSAEKGTLALWLCLGGWMAVTARPADDPLSDLLQPFPLNALASTNKPSSSSTNRTDPYGGLAVGNLYSTNAAPDGSGGVVLRPPTARRPRKPPFELKAGDRVLLLGDQLIEREQTYGYLETRMTSHFPDRSVTFRNLGEGCPGPLSRPDWSAPGGEPASGWLTNLLGRVATVKPNVVLMAYGTAVAARGDAGLTDFKTNLVRLFEGIRALDTNVSVRFILASPVAHEKRSDPDPVATNHNTQLALYARAVKDLADLKETEFAELFSWLRFDAEASLQRAKTNGTTAPKLTESGTDLTPYGYSRAVLGLERSLRWAQSNWRFGLMPSNSLRQGGFGIKLLEYKRNDTNATVVALDERLPYPNPPGQIDRLPGAKPQCYIQMPGFKPGRYTLKVDGRPVLTGTDEDWARYEIITEGPAWDQAEELRQTIVRKNDVASQRLRLAPGDVQIATLDTRLSELEAKIAKLRVPIKRTFTVTPADAPGDTSKVAEPAKPDAMPTAVADTNAVRRAPDLLPAKR